MTVHSPLLNGSQRRPSRQGAILVPNSRLTRVNRRRSNSAYFYFLCMWTKLWNKGKDCLLEYEFMTTEKKRKYLCLKQRNLSNFFVSTSDLGVHLGDATFFFFQ